MSGHRPFKELSDQIDKDPERVKRIEQIKREYESVPPTNTVALWTKFYVRGRGKPTPYPLDDE